MPSRDHNQLLYSVSKEYIEKGYDLGQDALKLSSHLHSMGWYPDLIMSNGEEIVIIEAIVTSDQTKPQIIKDVQPLFSKRIRLDKRRLHVTNIFVIDREVWAWAQYKAKTLGYQSVSEYVFELIKCDRQQNILKKKEIKQK